MWCFNFKLNQVVVLAGKPWAADGDVDRQQDATEKINHSIIGVPASQTDFNSHNDDDQLVMTDEHHAGLSKIGS